MSAAQLAIWLSGAGVLVCGGLALVFLRDPLRGMAIAAHRPEQLPQVMADRYVAFTLLAAAATLHGEAGGIAVLFAVFAVMGLADAWIYARAGHAHGRHLAAGLAAALVAGVALLALLQAGAEGPA
ncbi:MAG: hypothetical protein Kow0058_16220 [Roseovarius sp.]